MMYAEYPDILYPFPFPLRNVFFAFLLLWWDPLSARHHIYMPPHEKHNGEVFLFQAVPASQSHLMLHVAEGAYFTV